MEGKLHVYYPSRHLNVFESIHYKDTSVSRSDLQPPSNILLFVGGLYDNFSSPGYISDIVKLFPIKKDQRWRVMHVQLTSAIRGWGQVDIDRDIEEIGACVTFIRQELFGEESKIILMGHSTGCQDIMHYLTATNEASSKKLARPAIQGAIFQAPVSDREGILDAVEKSDKSRKAFERCMEMIRQTPESDHKDHFLPLSLIKPLLGPTPVSMSRFLSLASPGSPSNPSSEDFFSSDLEDDRLKATFGYIATNKMLGTVRAGKPTVLLLISDSDEHMPKKVNKQALLARWIDVIESNGSVCSRHSTSIPNALHDISGDDLPSQVARLLVMRSAIIQYLEDVIGDIDDSTRAVVKQDHVRLIEQDSRISTQLKDFKL